ncbi:hypothetical protein Chor_013409 [Crotalus horridus]
MSAGRAKKVKMATKSCPECDQQSLGENKFRIKASGMIPVESRNDAKRRRTERVKREKINPAVNKDLENRKRSRSHSQSDHSRRGRGRPKAASSKKHDEEKGLDSRSVFSPTEKQEKEVDMYANLSDEKAFVFSVALAEINRKIINQRLIL